MSREGPEPTPESVGDTNVPQVTTDTALETKTQYTYELPQTEEDIDELVNHAERIEDTAKPLSRKTEVWLPFFLEHD